MRIDLQQTVTFLQQADHILVLSHKSPDGDTIGSAAALSTALQRMGRHVRFACADPVPQKYTELFSQLAPEEFEPQCIIAVDLADTQLLGAATEQYKDQIDLAIDHHISHKDYAKQTYVDPTAASTTQIIYQLLCAMGVPLDAHLANCLYTGLCTDTGCFRYPNTTAEAFRTAAALAEAGADIAELNRQLFDTKSRARLTVERLAMESIVFSENGRFAMMQITEAMMQTAGATESDIEGLAALPRQIEGVLIAATLREKESGVYKISLRATPPYDASAICARFGGGGLKGAAGCVIAADLATAQSQLQQAASTHLHQTGV